jgi:transcriptional regulator with XRE-family HTH domain
MVRSGRAGYFTAMSKEVLSRVQRRLIALGLKEAPAAVAAGLSDSAIRNVRRKIEAGEDAKFSLRTLEALAPVLKTTAAWLLEEVGDEEIPEDQREMNAIFPFLSPEDRRHVLSLTRRLRRNDKDDDTKSK